MKYNKLLMPKKIKNKYVKISENNYLSEKKLSYKVVKNGVILPADYDKSSNPKLWAIGGVVDENDIFVEESSSRYLFGGYYEHNEDFEEYKDYDVVYFGPFIKHWGHFICDQITRLWFVLENPKKYKIAYCGWDWGRDGVDIEGNYLELLNLLGIGKDQLINIQRPTRFKNIIIPDISFIPEQYYTKEFQDITNKIVSNCNINIKCPEKIYFTRTALNNNKEQGEESINKYMETQGYVVLSPEKISVSEQIYYLNHAKNIAMVSGSISHNIMFAKNSSLNIIILNKMYLLNGYQCLIDHMSKSEISYIDVYKKIFPVLFGKGPFLLYVSKNLQKYFKTKVKSRIKFRQYIWYFKMYFKIYSKKEDRRLLKIQKDVI